jgi:hypothetical protein
MNNFLQSAIYYRPDFMYLSDLTRRQSNSVR